MYDLNHDGDLSYDEIKPYLDAVLQNTPHTDEDLRTTFDAIDTNHDGAIDKNEMFHFLSKIVRDPDDI